jgi:hypothetical protein
MLELNENYGAISQLHKKATALKKTDIHHAIECLREANNIIEQSGSAKEIEPLLRLPLFLQQAGLFDDAVEEFNLLLHDAEKDAVLCIPENNRTENTLKSAIHFRHWAIYDKMRIAYKRQKLIHQSEEYSKMAAEHRAKGHEYNEKEEIEFIKRIKRRRGLINL